MEKIRGTIRLTRLEAQRVFVDDHRVRGAIIAQPLSVEPDKKGSGYYLNEGNLKLVRRKTHAHPDLPYAIVKA